MPFCVWYCISWTFYLWILVVVFKAIGGGKKGGSDKARKVLNVILWLLAISWTAYAVAIVLPQLWLASGSGVARQFIFTIADITSKAVYGVLLGWVAMIRTKDEGEQSTEGFQNTSPRMT